MTRQSPSSVARLAVLSAGILTFALICLAIRSIEYQENTRCLQETRAATQRELGAIRARLESALNRRLFITTALKAYVTQHPGLSTSDFAQLSQTLQQECEGIRSFTLIRDHCISDVYPREGNEGAIGLDLLAHPQQRDAVLHAIATRRPWLAGPVKLVQGREAFIHRVPVYPPSAEGRQAYWGMVSIVIDKEHLLAEIDGAYPHDLQFAIRGTDAMGSDGAYFLGTSQIETFDPIVLDVELPTGEWQVLAVPSGGWPAKSPLSVPIRWFGLATALLVGLLVCFLLHSLLQYRQASLAATAASRAKSDFLANMSHEIRTPMTAILGYIDLLAEEIAPAQVGTEVTARVDTIRQNAQHLLVIINDILDMSKIEAGKLMVERVEVSIAQLAHEVIALMQHRAQAKGIELNCRFLTVVPDRIDSDPTRLRQILLNLVGNAIKFTEVGAVSLQIDYAQDTDSGELNFRVIDSGIGMTEEQRSRIAEFRAFSQADYSTTRQYGGTGLGLRISNSLAEILGGRIIVESEYGVGSQFTLSLQIPLTAEQVMIQPAAGSVPPTKPPTPANTTMTVPQDLLKGLRLLLAEDGPDNQRLISFLLRKAGAEVEVVENGQLALQQAMAQQQAGAPFDLILMDMQMPVMDGYTAATELRRANYTRPIVALTAHALSEDRQKCLQAGCDDFAVKPIDRQALFQIIVQWTKRCQQVKQLEPDAAAL